MRAGGQLWEISLDPTTQINLMRILELHIEVGITKTKKIGCTLI